MDFSGLVLAEAVLSYVGVGVDPSMISFGTMINAARMEMAREPMVWWALLAAFSFMFALVLSANLFADAVQNAFDPRVRTLPTRIGTLRAENANKSRKRNRCLPPGSKIPFLDERRAANTTISKLFSIRRQRPCAQWMGLR